MLNHRLRRWPSTKPQPVKPLVFTWVVFHYSQQADWFHLTFCDTSDYMSRLLPLFRFAAFWWDRPSNKRESIAPVLVLCWAAVVDDGRTLSQHRFNVSRFPLNSFLCFFTYPSAGYFEHGNKAPFSTLMTSQDPDTET